MCFLNFSYCFEHVGITQFFKKASLLAILFVTYKNNHKMKGSDPESFSILTR